jgi:penicillin-binding protein 2
MPVPCNGGLQFGNRYFKCWTRRGHGSLDLLGAVAQSCDVYFYQLGLRVQLANMLADGVTMGFRDRTRVDLVNEVAPIWPPNVAYYDERYGSRGWSNAVTLNLAIGQGENTQTLMNMVRFYAALASETGKAPTPYLVRPDTGQGYDLALTRDQLNGLRAALVAVVEKGTAARSRTADFKVAGKTGTAQNPHGKDHGWFIGFAPAEKPEIIIGAIFEFGEHGTVVAPYVVRAIRRYILGPDGTEGKRAFQRLNLPGDATPSEPTEPVPQDSTTAPRVETR